VSLYAMQLLLKVKDSQYCCFHLACTTTTSTTTTDSSSSSARRARCSETE
jgi:hypothetical protein